MRIKDVKARQIFDSRGNPTVEVKLVTDKGIFKAGVPSGASTGSYEALELRDNLKEFKGKGVLKAVENVNKIISRALIGKTIDEVDDSLLLELDGTPNKSRLGANAILGVSMAMYRAKASNQDMELWQYISKITRRTPKLPHPYSNVINGGLHAGNDLMFQEFMLVPQEKNFHQDVKTLQEAYMNLKELLKKKYGSSAINVGDEGGFAPNIKSPLEALDLLQKVINNSTGKLKIALDVAATEIKTKKGYEIEKGRILKNTELINYYEDIIANYPIISIEDPFAEDDYESYKLFKPKIQVVGDDLLVTNPKRIRFAIKNNLVNALLLKVNQIGSVSEAIDAAKLSFRAKWNVMVSHRSGETNDDFISDLCVGLGCGQAKIGGFSRGERLAKYNRLLEIEETWKGVSF
ncbi:MAG: phosphopyruvate hydratase [Candidatus Woesearchaeota archaeon]